MKEKQKRKESVLWLISDALPFGRPWYGRSHDAVIRVYDDAGNVIETHEQAREFREAS